MSSEIVEVSGAGGADTTAKLGTQEEGARDFDLLLSACRTIDSHMKPGATVAFESAVWPGATEEVCVIRAPARPTHVPSTG